MDRLLFLTFLCAGDTLRRHAQKSTVFAGTFTTISGCQCKDDCYARAGSGWKCDTCKTEDRCGKWSLTGHWDYCDYSAQTVQSFISRSASSKQSYYWSNIVANKTRYPKYPLLSNFLTSVQTTFDNYRPEMPPKREKMIHTIGSVCQIKVAIGSSSPYTGLLAPGTHKGFIRLGGAVEFGDGLTPGLGFKFPRSGVHDGDWVSLYSLAFGDQWNFFGKNQSNHIAPGEGFTTVLVNKFEEASNCAVQIGLSDLARYSQSGRESNPPKFPFKLFLVANSNLKTGQGAETIDGVHAELDSIPQGSSLYSMYACRTAKGDELEPTESLEESCGSPLFLGDIRTTSQCTTSWYGDKSFHIRHQRIEEDWLLDPSLMSMSGYSADVACDKRQELGGAPPKCGADGMLNSDA